MIFFRKHAWGLALGACAISIFATKALLIAYAAPRVPFLDQWDAIGQELFVPLLNGNLTMTDLWRIHNDHPLILTRLQSLILYFANDRQWDPLLEIVVNAQLHIITFFGLIAIFKSFYKSYWQWWLLASFLIVWISPHAYENTLWGFQNAFYYLLGSSFACLYFLIVGKPFGKRWFLGVLFAAIAILSQRSGLLAPLCAGLVIGLRSFLSSFNRRDLFAAILLVAVAAAALVYIPSQGNDSLKASSFQQFLGALGIALAWPWLHSPWVAGIMLTPLFLWFETSVRRLSNLKVHDYFLLAAWLLIGGNMVAIAWFRCGDVCYLTSRHSEIVAFVVPLGVASWASAIDAKEDAVRWLIKSAATIWGILIVSGLCVLGYRVTRGDITDRHNVWPKQVAFIRQVSLAPQRSLWRDKNALETASFAPHPVIDLFARDDFKKIMPWRIQTHSLIAAQSQVADTGLWNLVTNPEHKPIWQLPKGATATSWSTNLIITERSCQLLPIRGDWRGDKLKLTLISADGSRIAMGTGNAIHTDWFPVRIPVAKGDRYQLEVATMAEHGAAEISPIRSLGRLTSIYEPVLNTFSKLFSGSR
jgi:hypothetical protein